MLSWLARWFEPVVPSQEYRRSDFLWLGLIPVIAVILRFWALGEASLHGDEDIMGLAARGVLEHGTPILPSGMVYVRAPLHVYLIAGSMAFFGDNEWAIRLPSAVVGSLCIPMAFLFGRRFLGPRLNLMFVALVALLPTMIEISKTGRMYVFLVAGLLLVGWLVFRWEATGHRWWLAAALVAWLLTFQFHALAVFAIPLFLFPGLANRSVKQLLAGAVASGLALAGFKAYSTLMAEFYPSDEERLPGAEEVRQYGLDLLTHEPRVIALASAAVLVVIALAWIGRSAGGGRPERILGSLGLVGGAIACALVQYHIGAIVLVLGAMLWVRSGGRLGWLVGVALTVLALAILHAVLLHATGEYSVHQLVGALTGLPSVAPILTFIEFTPFGMLTYLFALGLAFVAVSQGRTVPVTFLLFVMTVWAPLLMIGVVKWNVPLRYLIGLLPFFLVCLVAGLEYTMRWLEQRWRVPMSDGQRATLAVVVLIAMVNPANLYAVARNDHRLYPDYRGAAEFVRAATAGSPDAIVIAEDSINQTYYLGRVDYRLLNVAVARTHSVLSGGVLLGQYTGSQIIGSGGELLAVLQQAPPRPVFIIGAGQYADERGVLARGNGIAEILASGRLEVVYEGRDDGRTTVWKARALP